MRQLPWYGIVGDMRQQSKLLLAARTLGAAIIGAFVAVAALPEDAKRIALGGYVAAVIALLVVLAVGWRRPTCAAVGAGIGALLSTGAIAYLASLDPDGADIPLAGVGALFAGLVILIVAVVKLRSPGGAESEISTS